MTSFELWAFTNGDNFMIISSNSNLFTIRANYFTPFIFSMSIQSASTRVDSRFLFWVL